MTAPETEDVEQDLEVEGTVVDLRALPDGTYELVLEGDDQQQCVCVITHAQLQALWPDVAADVRRVKSS